MKTVKQISTQMVKLCVIACMTLLLMIAACSKNNNTVTTTPPGNANVAVVNASPGTSMYSVYNGSTNIYPGNTLTYGSVTGVAGASPYEQITSGNDTIKLSANGTTYPVDTSFNFITSGYYTVFAYDTANGSGNLKTLILKDNLTPPPSGDAEVRFINLSPSILPLNVWLVNADTTMKDTTTFNNISYVGSLLTVSPDSLATFNNMTPGTYWVYFDPSAGGKSSFSKDSVTFASGGIYTIYAKGYANGLNGTDSLGIGIVKNF